jgi:hypothetical protein
MRCHVILGSILAAFAAAAAACGLADFDPITQVDSVRILASRADKPYAKPGDSVHLEVLAVDQRADRTRPMNLYWIPLVCVDPPNDAYYGCFAPSLDGGAADAANGAGAAAGLPRPGVDLTPFLKTGTTYDFTMPADAISRHKTNPGNDAPYGLAILFNVACAGHLEATPVDPAGGPQQVPIGCFDEQKNRLDASQYVIGFTRIYAYADRTNTNPSIDQVTFQGNPVDLAKGIKMDRCVADKRANCPELKIDVTVPDAVWEINPGDKDPNGDTRHEQVYVDYYASIGQFEDAVRLLYDPVRGKIDDTAAKYQAPNDAGEGTMWVVIHDNRGGASWVIVPLHAH